MEVQFKCLKCGHVGEDMYELTCPQHSQYYSYYDLNSYFENDSLIGEGNTPLVELKGYSSSNRQVFAKCEYNNPSGSVKDREVSAVFKFVKDNKIDEVFMVSGGSGAKSASLFSKKLGIRCTCILPHGTAKEIEDCLRENGTKSIKGKYDYERTFIDTIDQDLCYNITSGINPFASEGTRIIGKELREKLPVVDYVLVPMGNGTLIDGVWKGLKENYKIPPTLIGVELDGADPINQALKRNVDYYELEKVKASKASAICARASFCSPKAIRAVLESNGEIITISEYELMNEIEKIDRRIINPCPSSVSVLAALEKSLLKGVIVCVISG